MTRSSASARCALALVVTARVAHAPGGGRHGCWRRDGQRRGRHVSRGTAPPGVLLKPVRSSRAQARSRTAVARRCRGRGAHRRSRLHARRDTRELGPPAWANARRGLSTGAHWVEVWFGAKISDRGQFFSQAAVSDDPPINRLVLSSVYAAYIQKGR